MRLLLEGLLSLCEAGLEITRSHEPGVLLVEDEL